jgi:hypothetical protein
MRNLILFSAILATVAVSVYVGMSRFDIAAAPTGEQAALDAEPAGEAPPQTMPPPPPMAAGLRENVPHIGSIQVLNGCGMEGAATRMAEFLRARNFDVKDIGNASSWNHQSTMIISRSANMSLANEIERVLRTGKVVMIRNNEQLYDVTVITGPDFEERIKR